jgi:hypothetical protein
MSQRGFWRRCWPVENWVDGGANDGQVFVCLLLAAMAGVILRGEDGPAGRSEEVSVMPVAPPLDPFGKWAGWGLVLPTDGTPRVTLCGAGETRETVRVSRRDGLQGHSGAVSVVGGALAPCVGALGKASVCPTFGRLIWDDQELLRCGCSWRVRTDFGRRWRPRGHPGERSCDLGTVWGLAARPARVHSCGPGRGVLIGTRLSSRDLRVCGAPGGWPESDGAQTRVTAKGELPVVTASAEISLATSRRAAAAEPERASAVSPRSSCLGFRVPRGQPRLVDAAAVTTWHWTLCSREGGDVNSRSARRAGCSRPFGMSGGPSSTGRVERCGPARADWTSVGKRRRSARC